MIYEMGRRVVASGRRFLSTDCAPREDARARVRRPSRRRRRRARRRRVAALHAEPERRQDALHARLVVHHVVRAPLDHHGERAERARGRRDAPRARVGDGSERVRQNRRGREPKRALS